MTDKRARSRPVDDLGTSDVAAGALRPLPPEAGAGRRRLDAELVARGLVATRARARDLVLRGEVLLDGATAVKPAQLVAGHRSIELAPGAGRYASRGAVKLAAALDALAIRVEAAIALDVGAAQGGFTEVLLSRGATKVYAVENGHGQLVEGLRRDPRVVSLEETDARVLTRRIIPDPIDVVVADVSFISLLKVLPTALKLTAPGARLVALVKPQFESEPDQVGRGGIVRDAAVREAAVERVKAWLDGQPGWRVVGTMASPIEGGSGNIEFLLGAIRDA